MNGTIPEAGTVCDVSTRLLSNKKWRDVRLLIDHLHRTVSKWDDSLAICNGADASKAISFGVTMP